MFPVSTILAAALAGTGSQLPAMATPAAPPKLEAYVVEAMGWEELRCFDYDPDTCSEHDPIHRVRYRVVEVIHGTGWSGERTFDLAGNTSDYGVETTRTLLVLRAPNEVIATVTIDPVVGGGWAHCGEPPGFERDDLALVQPVEFAGVFADVSRLSAFGRKRWGADTYRIDGDLVRCKRGVPAGTLLRWIETGGRP